MADLLAPPMRPINYEVMYEVEGTHWWFRGRRAIVRQAIEEARGERGGAILDIGCGTGANLQELKRYGSTTGIDASRFALSYCVERGLTRVVCASADRLPFLDSSFDLVTALDILEHVDDDVQVLREIQRVMRPDGVLLVFVPAFRILWGPNDDQCGHKRRYRRRELHARIEASGLTLDRISYANMLMFLPIWIGRTILRLFRARGQLENRINHPVINEVLAWLFSLEAMWLRRHTLPLGVSLVCVAQRRSAP